MKIAFKWCDDMTIIKIYMFIVMILCPFLNWYNEKWFKYTLQISLWFISFSILWIIKEMGY